MADLYLVRHGQSIFNKENLFTGWMDVALTEKGKEEAQKAGRHLLESKFRPDMVFCSELIRAQQTMLIMLAEMEMHLPIIECTQALNERHYGELQGKNKAETAEKFGAEQVQIWRRSYDIAPPKGESLKDTAERTLPYFNDKIRSTVVGGKNTLVVAHGNSLRSIVMELEDLSPAEILKREIPTGQAIKYSL